MSSGVGEPPALPGMRRHRDLSPTRNRAGPRHAGDGQRMDVMTEATQSKGKSNVFAAPFAGFPELPKFEMPKFEMPTFDMSKFDMSNMEVPAAFRDFAEKGIAQAKDGYEKVKAAAEEATDLMENTYATATKGMSQYGLMALEAARANTNAGFEFAATLLGAKSMAEFVELSSAHARKQFETISAQTKDLTALAQKVATDTAEPIKGSVTKVLNKAA